MLTVWSAQSRPVRVAWVVGLVSVVLFAAAGPARAAFPGRNGRLVVVPPAGGALRVVGVDGAHPRQICGVGTRCHGARNPVWSPDGSEIAFASSKAGDGVIYGDGSCLSCPVPGPWLENWVYLGWGAHNGPGFLPDGSLAVWLKNGPSPLAAMNTDGTAFKPFKVSGSWRQPAWSPTGQLAAVRLVKRKPEVFVLDPLTGSARQLTYNGASSPSWSPDGRRLAVVHGGWVELIGSGGGRMRRLTRGGAPAWAPNGRELAFVGARDRLFVIAARGGRPRPVGHIRAQWVDWQPVKATSATPCQAPAGSSVVAGSPDAEVTIDPTPVSRSPSSGPGPFSVLGCLTSDGRQRVLEGMPPEDMDDAYAIGVVVVAGDYAALVNEWADPHYGGSKATVAVFDLRTGAAVANRGGQTVTYCPAPGVTEGCDYGIDQLAVGADGITAAHMFAQFFNFSDSSWTTTEEIVANDSTGTHMLDSISTTVPYLNGQYLNSPAPWTSLSQLAFSGHTLTWSHAGSPRSAQLH